MPNAPSLKSPETLILFELPPVSIDRMELERLLADRPHSNRSAMQVVRDSYNDISVMRERGLSWAQISEFLAQHGVTARDDLPISPITLRSAFFLVGIELRNGSDPANEGDEPGSPEALAALHKAAMTFIDSVEGMEPEATPLPESVAANDPVHGNGAPSSPETLDAVDTAVMAVANPAEDLAQREPDVIPGAPASVAEVEPTLDTKAPAPENVVVIEPEPKPLPMPEESPPSVAGDNSVKEDGAPASSGPFPTVDAVAIALVIPTENMPKEPDGVSCDLALAVESEPAREIVPPDPTSEAATEPKPEPEPTPAPAEKPSSAAEMLALSPQTPVCTASVGAAEDISNSNTTSRFLKGDCMLGTIFVLNDRGGVGKTLLSHHLMATAMLEGLQLKVVEYEVNERLARLFGPEVVEHRRITQDFINMMGSADGFYEFWDLIGPELQRGGRLYDFGGNISQWFFNWAEVSGFDYYVGEGERLTFMVPVTVDLASLSTGMATLERIAAIAPKAKRILVENGTSGPFSQLEDSNYARRKAEMVEREGLHVIAMAPCTAPAWARLTGHRLDQVAKMTREDLVKLGMTPPVASRSLIIIHEWLRGMRQALAPYIVEAFRQTPGSAVKSKQSAI